MYQPFFPTAQFAWCFVIVLLAGLAVASYVDLKWKVIPKWITVSLFVAGVVISIVRSAILGHQAHHLWILATDSIWRGALDGLLFGLTGAAAAFAVMFVCWIVGTCGGGDVKLFTMLGAWLGPLYLLYVLLASLIALFIIFAVKAVTGCVTLKTFEQARNWRRQRSSGNMGNLPKSPKWRVSYSLPVAIATLVVLIWVFRAELHLAVHVPQEKAVANAR